MRDLRPPSHCRGAPKNELAPTDHRSFGVLILATRALAVTIAAATLAACSSGGNLEIGKGQSSTGLNVDFSIAYIKRAIPADFAEATQLAQLRAKDDVRLPRGYWSKADVY